MTPPPVNPSDWTDEELKRLPPPLRDRELLVWLWAQDGILRHRRQKGHYSVTFNHDERGIPRNVNLQPVAPTTFTVVLGALAEIP